MIWSDPRFQLPFRALVISACFLILGSQTNGPWATLNYVTAVFWLALGVLEASRARK